MVRDMVRLVIRAVVRFMVRFGHGYDLRHQRHDRILASNHDQRNFIDRQLHKHSYWLDCRIVVLNTIHWDH